MLKGQVFANQLFENQIFALFIDTFANGTNGISNNYKNGMAVTYSGSNVTIDSGAILIQGRLLEEDTSTTISAGADNMYCKLIIEIDLDKTNTTTEFNQGTYKIIKGANAYPALTQTNIVKNNAGVYQYELARFRNPSTGITDFQDMRTFIDFEDIYEEIRQHIQDIDDGALFVLKSGTASLSGAVTGSASFDSSSNLSIATNFASNTWSKTLTTDDIQAVLNFRQVGNTIVVRTKINFRNTSEIKTALNLTISDAPAWAKRTTYDTTSSTDLWSLYHLEDDSHDDYSCILRLNPAGNLVFNFGGIFTTATASSSGLLAFEMTYVVY